MTYKIKIKDNTFVLPNITGYSKVANHGPFSKPGYFIFYGGNPILAEFNDVEAANKSRNELISALDGYYNNIGDKPFNSTNKEQGNNKGFFGNKNKGKFGR